VPLVIDAPTLSPSERIGLWTRELAGADAADHQLLGPTALPTEPGTLIDGYNGFDPSAIPTHFVLGPGQVARAVRAASAAALIGTGAMTAEDLRRGARAQNAAGLERLARRVEPAVGWDDIVLPESARSQLRDLASRARNRD